jgi:Protein of unknown function (DUF3551)
MRAATLASILLGVALVGVPLQAAYAQQEKQPFCLQSATGSLNCTYDSLEQCHQILGGVRRAARALLIRPGRSRPAPAVRDPRIGRQAAGMSHRRRRGDPR